MKKRLIVLCVLVLAVALAMGIVEANAVSVIDSGTCGANLTWKLTDDGTLTISGTGSMYGYTGTGSNVSPWDDYRHTGIKSIVIESGVTSIGNNAFWACSANSVSIPDTVTKIGESCFGMCDGLRSVVLPYGIKSIPSFAFYMCELLESIVIPNTVQSFGQGCFTSCSSLVYFIIPDGVTNLPSSMLYGCSSLEYVQIPKSVTKIESLAFHDCGNLTDVYYTGTQSQFNSIDIRFLDEYNESLKYADIHYSSKAPCVVCTFGATTRMDNDYHIRECSNCGKIEKNAHSWDGGVVTIQPNCRNEGIKIYTCEVCKATKKEIIPRNNTHSYGEWGYENDSTHRKVCSICANSYNEKHTWTTGNVESKCSICNSTRWLTRAAKPIITHYTNNSVTLLAVDGYEYSLDFKNWQDSNEFTGLSPNGLYVFYQRIKNPTVSQSSEPSEGVTFITPSVPGSTASNYDQLREFINKSKNIDGYGYKTYIAYQDDGQYTDITVKFSNEPSGIVLRIVIVSNFSTRIDSQTQFLIKRDSTTISAEHIMIAYMDGVTDDSAWGSKSINRSLHTALTQYNMGVSGKYISSSSFDSMFNTNLKKLCEYSDEALFEKLGFGLRGLGFSSYSGKGEVVCDSVSGKHIGNTEIRGAWEASCLIDGYTGNKCCTACNEVIEKGVSIEKIGHHTYDNECDNSCNKCKEIRVVDHSFSSNCDSVCDLCGLKRKTDVKHTFDGADDQICNLCGGNRYIEGDVDGSDEVDSDDAIHLLYNVLFGEEGYPLNQSADFDGNGITDSDDAIYLLYHVLFGAENYPLV